MMTFSLFLELGQELDKKNNEINELSRECSKQLKSSD